MLNRAFWGRVFVASCRQWTKQGILKSSLSSFQRLIGLAYLYTFRSNYIRPGHDVKLYPHFHCHSVTGNFLYWCVMRPTSQRFSIYRCIYTRIFFSNVSCTNSLSVLMCRKAVNQSINQSINQLYTAIRLNFDRRRANYFSQSFFCTPLFSKINIGFLYFYLNIGNSSTDSDFYHMVLEDDWNFREIYWDLIINYGVSFRKDEVGRLCDLISDLISLSKDSSTTIRSKYIWTIEAKFGVYRATINNLFTVHEFTE